MVAVFLDVTGLIYFSGKHQPNIPSLSGQSLSVTLEVKSWIVQSAIQAVSQILFPKSIIVLQHAVEVF